MYLFKGEKDGVVIGINIGMHIDSIILVCNIMCECGEKKMEEDYTRCCAMGNG